MTREHDPATRYLRAVREAARGLVAIHLGADIECLSLSPAESRCDLSGGRADTLAVAALLVARDVGERLVFGETVENLASTADMRRRRGRGARWLDYFADGVAFAARALYGSPARRIVFLTLAGAIAARGYLDGDEVREIRDFLLRSFARRGAREEASP